MRAAAVALLLAACGSSSSGPQSVDDDLSAKPVPPGPPVPPVPPVDAAPPVDAVPSIAPMAITASATTDGVETALHWGFAEPRGDGLGIELFSSPIDCEHHSQVADKLPGAHVLIIMPLGPGAKYFAGHPATAQLLVTNTGQALDVPDQVTQIVGKQGFMAQLNDAACLVTLEKVPAKAHQHVRGTVDAFEANLIGVARVHGAFDVELCEDDVNEHPMRSTAPSSPARGRRGNKTYAPAYWQAIVTTQAGDRDQATDLAIHRSPQGSLAQIWRIVGYPKRVPCPPPGKEYVDDVAPIVDFQGIGGASREHPVAGVQEPTTFTVPKLNGELKDLEAVWPAWIQIDALSFAPGSVIHGSVWAEAPSYDDAGGTFGGRFDATICGP